MSGSHSPTRVSTTEDSSADYFRERAQTIRDDLRAKGRAPRVAPPPDVDLPEAVTSVAVPIATDDALDENERRYMEKLRARKLGEAEAAVLECLGDGRSRALTNQQIAGLTGHGTRAVRSAVEILRLNEFPICSATDGRAGYWIAATGEEFAVSACSNRRRALRQLAVTGAMKRAAAELFGQTVFELDEAGT